MAIIQGGLSVNGIPRNDATAKLWSAGAFSSAPAKDTPLPTGTAFIASGTTDPENGMDGGYRFEGVTVGEYYVSLEWKGGITYDYHALNINPTVSIVDFGAQQGDFDNTTAISAAIAAASVSGGSVYIPGGTWVIAPSGTTHYIPIVSDVTVFGNGPDSIIKVKDANVRYEFIFAASPSGSTVNNFKLANLTVDQNTQNVSESISDTAGRRARGIALFAGDNLIVDGVKWDNLGGINTCLFNGTAISRVRITNNTFYWNPSGGVASYDNTAVYINGKESVVSNNMFRGEPSGNPRGAIQVTNGVSVVGNNVSIGYRKLIDVVAVTSPGRPASDITVVGNTASRCLAGIQLWSPAGAVLTNVNISNNSIQVSHDDHSQGETAGIALINDASMTGLYKNIVIDGNSVVYQPTPAAGLTLTDNSCYGIGIACRGNVENVIVTHNLVSGAPVRGIRVGNVAGPISISGAFIAYNQIINCGCNVGSVQARRSGITIESNLADVKVTRNFIIDTSGTFSGYSSISADSTASSVYQRVQITDNFTQVYSQSGDYRFNCPTTKGLDFGEGFGRAPIPLTDSARYRFTDQWPPVSGSWDAGDYVWVRNGVNTSGSMRMFKVVSGGTAGSTVITADTNSGSTTITLSQPAGFKVGDYITIAGVTGVKRLISIGNDGTAEISASASATVSAGSVSYFTVLYEQAFPRESLKSAAPTAGTWNVGDRVWNNAPAGGGIPGWICVTSGTPGTWKAMAVLAA